MQGLARVSAAVPVCMVGDAMGNAQHTVALCERSHDQGDALVVFPELGLTGYTARDLFHDTHLLSCALDALGVVIQRSADLSPLILVGLPLRVGQAVFNVAVAVQHGKPLAVIPKSYLPNYREFEERRWFRSGVEVADQETVLVAGREVPFGTDILLVSSNTPDLVVGVEICEDIWVQTPPSAYQVSAGATVICNLSASNFTIGKAELRRLLARSSSDRGKCAYVYVAAGPGESSTDVAFDADAFICENGAVLVESQRFSRVGQLVSTEIDVEVLMRERWVTQTFGDCAAVNQKSFRTVMFESSPTLQGAPMRRFKRHPFVPDDPKTLGDRCWEIFEIQTNALATRMKAIGRPKLVLGLSGGLDSTQAALVAAGALDLVGQPRSDLRCITMPGFGTTEGTKSNAHRLAEDLAASIDEVSVAEASRLVLELVGHPAAGSSITEMLSRLREQPALGDIALENVQARMRTLVLMTIANREGGLVVGTGDLSEKALGWSTYAGDHIAMYDVNAGIPKTLIQSVIRWVANERAQTWSMGDPVDLRETLFSILETPISPELLPTDQDGQIAQLTEATIGPYELHDFFLYHVVRHGARPRKVLDMARLAFGPDYDVSTLKHWLSGFYRRFFHNQFKRSCTADAPKVGQVALSPRGDWRMPSDAQVRQWLAQVESYE